MFPDLTKVQKRALRQAAAAAHARDRKMSREDRDAFYLETRSGELPIIVGGAVANGILAIEDVPEPARELVADVAERLRSVREVSESSSRQQPDVLRYDPDAVVSLSAVVGEVDTLRDEATTLYVNRRTGEVAVPSDDFFDGDGEGEDDPAFLAEDDLTDAEDRDSTDADASEGPFDSNPDWVALVDKFDVDEYDIMRRFARNAAPAASRDMEEALRGRGAFRRFRDVIELRGLVKEWYAFREERLTDLVRFVLEEKGIPFRR